MTGRASPADRDSDSAEPTRRPVAPIVPATADSGPGSMPFRLNEAPEIDGQLDDLVWRDVVRVSQFVQMNPFEGAQASEATEVYLGYDSDNFYVGINARYSDLSLILANRVERDETTRDDKVTIFFDSFFDQQRNVRISILSMVTVSKVMPRWTPAG